MTDHEMNERIRQLAEQANAFARENVEYSRTEGFEIFTDKLYEVSCEKFAELIVRECCVVILADPRLGDVRSATRGCARSIKEHFGVEE